MDDTTTVSSELAAPAATPCTVDATGTEGTVIRSRLLTTRGAFDGELMVDRSGDIACAAADCSATTGYAAATHLTCPKTVLSPGFINAHDHTDYDADPPVVTGTRQYQHRQEWRTGADQAQQIPTQKSTSDPKLVAAAELRFLLSGVTSIVGSGGTQGLVRNLAAAPAKLEGLQGKPVYFDSFPLGDSNGPPKRARQFGTHFAMSPSRGPTLVVCS